MYPQEEVDIAVIGAGMVGTLLAFTLLERGFKVALIEKYTLKEPSPTFDSRALALSPSSKMILSQLNIWQQLASKTTPINTVHISYQGAFGATKLHANEVKEPHLGYVLQAHHLGKALMQKINQTSVKIFAPTKQLKCVQSNNGWQLNFIHSDQNTNIHAKLLIGADGQQSVVRNTLNIGERVIDHSQSAIVANIKLKEKHNCIAYERFLATKPVQPLAMLPLNEYDCAMIWVVPCDQQNFYINLNEQEFLQELQQVFGWRLGKFTGISKRSVYPLKTRIAQKITKHNAVLMGNAAHFFHPIAGQSLNLSLRELATFVEYININNFNETTNELNNNLIKYAKAIQKDQIKTEIFVEEFLNIFNYSIVKPNLIKSLGLVSFDLIRPSKRIVAHLGSGKFFPLPKLALGMQ